MKKPHIILRRPIVTEKMLKLQETRRQYAFEVDPEATKVTVKQAVEKKFDVTVEGVRILNVKGKPKRMNTRRGLTHGKRANWRKAIVTLREGDSIDFFGTR
ncbi:MAG: 50S ribosomal protein L23 [candidate division KSB1 bacterium]|nr:50S ribosomal protein L23 [candidate division KSB1 bacterium]MDZ7294361.1 50S ribosomal protein L23 [candidate division KSB1 bacterium]MDZ7338205.1 50S ribosomal protein L23 [candidate division KSB1 bacterium]MDZ7384553.1 50S ribosomal protein L23 [candidate division KSB1 bacterium]MDZ7392850.1 50S ribosomal protein L23 [candidate division KSB1 bacterium]